jgi:hypothetical protein
VTSDHLVESKLTKAQELIFLVHPPPPPPPHYCEGELYRGFYFLSICYISWNSNMYNLYILNMVEGAIL